MSIPVRYHAFDSLRAFAMLLGIFFHAALSFKDPVDTGWVTNDSSRHVAVSFFVWASHGFRMQVFFLMSGFFAHLLYQRYGAQGFMVHRLKRIALPFALGLFTLVPVIMWLWLWSQTHGLTDAVSAQVSAAEGVPLTFTLFLQNIVPAHLWFLEYLMVFCFGAYLVVPLLSRIRLERGPFDRALRWLIETPWKPLWLALPAGLGVWWHGGWSPPVGSDSLVPEAPIVAYYGLFFVFGWLLYRHVDLLDGLTLHHRRYLALAVPLLATPVVSLMRSRVDDPNWGLYAAAAISSSAVYTWLMVFGLMGLFLRVFRRENARIRYISDSAYWLYLAHIPVVPFLHVIAAQVSAPLLVKYFAVTAVAFVLLFLSYEHMVRYTWLGALLNGRRHRGEPSLRHGIPATG